MAGVWPMTEPAPRVLHVLDHSLPMHSGYAFRTRAILKAQEANGMAVRGVTGLRHTDAGPDEETCEGLNFVRTPGTASGPAGLREWREISALARQVVHEARKWQPDVLHAHSPALCGQAAVIAGKQLGIPVVYEIRAFWEDAAVGNGTGAQGSLKYRLTRYLENRVIAGADAVVTICSGLKDDLVARGVNPAKISIMPNGVDLTLFGDPPPRDAALAAELDLGNGPVIGFIGSFYDYEGLDDLIAAMPALIAQHGDARLLLVGGGPMADALRAQAEASPAADAIRFVGRVPHTEVERYYSLCDIMAYPRKASRLTDLVTPLKPLEAMAQGKIVAASNVGGHRELITDGTTGALFPADDPAACAAALGALLADRADWDALKDRAREHVATQHDWARNALRYHDVYQALLSASPDKTIPADNEDAALASGPQHKPETLKNRSSALTKLGAHPAFPLVVALWFAVLLGLGSLVIPVALFERAIAATGLAALIPAAGPPLGNTARIAIALLAAGAGAVLGLLVGRQVYRLSKAPLAIDFAHDEDNVAQDPARRRFAPINAREELGADGFDGPGVQLAGPEADGANDAAEADHVPDVAAAKLPAKADESAISEPEMPVASDAAPADAAAPHDTKHPAPAAAVNVRFVEANPQRDAEFAQPATDFPAPTATGKLEDLSIGQLGQRLQDALEQRSAMKRARYARPAAAADAQEPPRPGVLADPVLDAPSQSDGVNDVTIDEVYKSLLAMSGSVRQVWPDKFGPETSPETSPESTPETSSETSQTELADAAEPQTNSAPSDIDSDEQALRDALEHLQRNSQNA